jgi:DNA adenine methylase
MKNHPVSQAPSPCKPFVKWVGGKSRILKHVVPRLPSGRRLIEPFVGGGAVFLGANFEEYLLSDSNTHLIELYQEVVSDRRDEFIEFAQTFFDEKYRSVASYAWVRTAFNQGQDRVTRAAQFLYLNKFGFNGLCRYNKSGAFNVPYGHPLRVPGFPLKEILAFSEKAKRATFINDDFASVMKRAQAGDVVYCDPPYLDPDGAKSFTAYGANGFDLTRQQELARLAKELALRGVPVAVSNHDCRAARELYTGAEIHAFSARRSISGTSVRRGAVGELLAIFR